MDNYELVFILEKEDNDKLKAIESIIQSFSGQIRDKKFFEKRRLAYPIKKITNGFYFDWMINLDKTSLKKLTQKFNLDNIMLRYLILKVE